MELFQKFQTLVEEINVDIEGSLVIILCIERKAIVYRYNQVLVHGNMESASGCASLP